MDVPVAETNKKADVQSAIYRISEVAQTAKNLDELYRSIHSIIGDLMPARNFYVALYDAAADLLHFPYFADEFDPPPAPLTPGKSLTGYVLRTGKALLATPQRFREMLELGELKLIGAPSVDWLGVPLKTHTGETFGVMVVQTYTESTRFTESDKEVLVFVSSQVAMAVERKRVEERIAALGYLKQQLIDTRSLNEKLKLVTDNVVEILGADFARIWIVRKADLCSTGCHHAAVTTGPGVCLNRTRCLHLVASSGRYVHTDGGHRRVPLDCYKIGRVASGKDSKFITNSVTTDPKVHDHEWARSLGLVSFAGHRLISKEGAPIGVLALFGKRPIVLHEEKLLEDLAHTTSQAILAGRDEESLRESQRAMSILLSNLPGMAYRCRNDPSWTMEFVSQGTFALTGFLPEHLIGNSRLAYGDIIHPEDRDQVWQDVQDAIAEKAPFELLYRIFAADGKIKWVWEKGRGVFDGNDVLVALEGFVTDTTARKQAEEEMYALQEQLRQSQKMEAIGRLAGGIAHDFNNLLTVISGYAELSLARSSLDAPLKDDIRDIREAARRASELTRQLLAFSRRQVMQMEIINLNSLLRGLDKILHRLIGEDIEVLTDLDESLECVRADRGQIEQVIMNLAVNARDAMPSGGKLVFATSNVELSDSYPHRHPEMLPGRYALLSVTDTGAGMSREVRERVFEPFFTTKEKGKGTGLGLSTVYGIIKQSEGYIWVDSKPGMGTTFQIYLGSVGDVTEEAEHRSQVEEASRGDETILLVEDDEGVRGLAREILQNSGYRIVESSGGEEAAEFYRESREPIHLILTDVVMPRLSGRELVNQLRPLRPETRVLYMSGYTDNSIVSQGALEKGIHYIQKPFTMEGLTRMVRETIDCA